MTNTPREYRTVLKHYDACSESVRSFCEHLPSLLKNYPPGVALAYTAQRVEIGDRLMLRAALMIKSTVNSNVATQASDEEMTREQFLRRFKAAFDNKTVPKPASDAKKKFTRVRDKVVHGQSATKSEQYEAIVAALTYAVEINKFCERELGNYRPFDPKGRSLSGKRTYSSQRISRLIAQGLGFFKE